MARTRPLSPRLFKEKSSSIVECYDISDLFKHYTRELCYIFDLDNTVIEPADEHQELGSDQWFVAFLKYAGEVDLTAHNASALTLVLAVYHAVQHHVQLQLVQPEIPDIIKIFKRLNNLVLALTARGSEIIEPTLHQLNRLGMDFSVDWCPTPIVLDIGVKENPPVFMMGIIFCGGHPKEKCLKAVLELIDAHPDILMIDDKVKYLDAVVKMVNGYGGNAIGLHYRRLDEKVQKHDFKQAQSKLIEMSGHLSGGAKDAMNKLKVRPGC